ncbi:MAG: glycosyltransferase family 4 protein [Sulfurimonas sp.]|nr:glycosyltransferase family 4 protein [Sulfurimonas sp.]
MKKILELCLSPDSGGLELYMIRASLYLQHKTEVVSVINKKGKLSSYYDESQSIVLMKKPSIFSLIFVAKKLASIIDKHSVDVIHAHWTKDLPLVVMAKRFSKRKPALVQTRNMTMTRFKNDFYHRWLYKNIDLMLPVTHQVKDQLEKFIPQGARPMIKMLYMGADVPKHIDEEQKEQLRLLYGVKRKFIVGIVGRIKKEKGQYLVIDAVAKLLDKGHEAQALIVGHAMSDEYLQELQADVAKRGLQEHVIFTGFTTEAQKLMQLCDCLVLATERETFGLVLIEAMACGVCVLGTNNAGPLEIIDDNQTGLLFEKNSSDAMAEKIESLLLDEEFKKKLAFAGQKKALERFNATTQFEKLNEILQKL